ncbi:MAG: adenylate kinase [Nanoarchaeota archaeon]|nr:adenylate kinase [Nanoarchaeota archaeon]MBU1854928.1 adenylate kinase [Nanoarchaeota archaeon]
MKLLFLGSPGVGKGTYAQVLKEVLNIPHISTGDLLRAESKKNSPLGRKISDIMLKGDLVSDEIMLEMLEERIAEKDCKKGFILDGFPRNLVQVNHLKNLIEISHVLNFKADDEVIIERLSGRLTCKKCSTIFHKTGNKPKKEGVCDACGHELYQRKDDTSEAVKKRLEVYKEKTKPLIDYFKNEGLLVEVIINKPISEIREQIITKVKDYLEGKTDKIGEIK